MTTPTVSVLMPVYNAGRYVAEAVESILGQTFADFEFLIVDDGSTDGSLGILREYAARDSRVRLTSRENRGLVTTLNELLAAAKGEYAARMDADDVCLPERFARQVAFLRSNPGVLAVGGAFIITDEAGVELTTIRPPVDDRELQSLALSGRNPFCHPAVMMRRAAVDAVGGYRQELMLAEDLDLWLRLGERGELAGLPHVLIRYREHGGSICAQNRQRQVDQTRRAADEAADRRGLPRRTLDLRPHRRGQDPRSRHELAIRNGWWCYLRGSRGASAKHAVRAIANRPWAIGGWRLLACTLVKTVRPPAEGKETGDG